MRLWQLLGGEVWQLLVGVSVCSVVCLAGVLLRVCCLFAVVVA